MEFTYDSTTTVNTGCQPQLGDRGEVGWLPRSICREDRAMGELQPVDMGPSVHLVRLHAYGSSGGS